MSWINKPEDLKTTRIAASGESLVADNTGKTTNDENQALFGEKRPRDEENGANSSPGDAERPAKLVKLDVKDSIRNHLPEIVGSGEREESFLQTSWLQIGDQLLEQAKKVNTISILPSVKSSNILLTRILTWSKQEHADTGKMAFIVVDDVALMDKYFILLESHIADKSFSKCEEDQLAPAQWGDYLKKSVVIGSSRFLLNSLSKGFLHIAQIHLLAITDAQIIENQDCHPSMPIVQVMCDFYRKAPTTTRPRVLALAALPSDRRYHFDSKTLKLEQTIDAKVFGISTNKREEILALPDRPNEIVLLYDLVEGIPETRLTKQIRQMDPTESIFAKYHRASRLAHEEVGPCASDLIWRRAVNDLSQGTEPWFDMADDDEHEAPSVDTIKRRIHGLVKNWTYMMPNLDATSKGFNVSHKFSRLVQVLATFRALGDGFRGIIFVQKRSIALVLTDLLRMMDDRLSFLRPQTVIGKMCATNEEYYRDIFQKFTSGVYNLLVATKSIEDLDLPKVSLVVRYDLFESQISHAYVRARTRGRESHLVHLIQRGNDVQRRILNRVTNIDASMLRWTEVLTESAESSIPPDTLRETINPYHSDSEDEDEGENQTCIKDAITGGRIYIQDATHVIYRYAAHAASLGMDIPDDHRLFSFESLEVGFDGTRSYRCIINLPGTVINNVSGDLRPIKALARRSACLKACELLHRSNLLDSKLVPLPSSLRNSHAHDLQLKVTPEMTEGILPGTRVYGRKQPDFWKNAPKDLPSMLYPIVMSVQGTQEDSIPYAPILILTREPSPDLPSFRIFISGVSHQVNFQRACSFQIDAERMNNVHLYTIRIYRAVMNKALTCRMEDMQYFFLPLSAGWKPFQNGKLDGLDVESSIPWDDVQAAARHWAVPIKPEDLESGLPDAVVQDRWIEFTRRYNVESIRRDLTPLSKPEDSRRERNYESLFAFCKAKRKNLEELKDYEQPIIQVNRLLPVANHLNPAIKAVAETGRSPAKYLIPELCAKFTLRSSVLQTAMLLPSVMRRVDDLLLVKEMDARLFDHAINEDLLHNAICTPSAGLEYDYERLELLGDAFLKYLSSVYVFVTHASAMEGSLHVLRQKIISNKALLHYTSRVGVPAYIQSKMFTLKAWHPPHYYVSLPPKRIYPPQVNGDKDKVSGKEELKQPSTADVSTEKSTVTEPLGEEISEEKPPNNMPEKEATPADGEVVETNQPVEAEVDDAMVEDDNMAVQDPGENAEPEPTADDPMVEDEAMVEANGTHNEQNNDDAMVQDEPVETPKTAPNGSVKASPPIKNKPSNEGKRKAKPKKKKGQDEQGTQVLGDKAIADVAEAIIGAAYISGGREAALKVTKSLSVPIANVDRWSDFGRKVLTPPPDFLTKLRPGSIVAIEEIIGHKFIRPHLLAQAMTHSSIQGYESTSYERLEFLGDAILDFMVIRHIFDRDQQLAPGALTMLKGAMVSNAALGAVCVWSGLDQHLLFESIQLQGSIQEYKVDLKSKQKEEYQLAEQENRLPGQYWLGLEPPKALSDVMESIIGAVYISDNFSPTGAEAIFDNVLKPFYDLHIRLHTLSHHPTKILLEILQAQGCHQFEITKEKIDNKAHSDVVVHDVILSSADDATQASAARMSSIFALDALEGDADFMKRVCDCRASNVKARKRNIEEALKETLSESVPEGISEVVPEGAPEVVPEVVPEAIPEAVDTKKEE